jgi:selenocysteine-specific elongation factor
LAGRIEAIYRRAGYETPLEEDIGRELQLNPYFLRKIMGTLLQEGKLIRLNNKVIYHRDALEKARQIVLDHLHEKRTITIAELKDQIHSSRKYACALLEYFDATGLTQRSGDAHMLK